MPACFFFASEILLYSHSNRKKIAEINFSSDTKNFRFSKPILMNFFRFLFVQRHHKIASKSVSIVIMHFHFFCALSMSNNIFIICAIFSRSVFFSRCCRTSDNGRKKYVHLHKIALLLHCQNGEWKIYCRNDWKWLKIYFTGNRCDGKSEHN